MRAQGWYRDPYDVHEDRYFSVGQPTKLVRDGDAEAYDPPPFGPPERELVVVSEREPTDGCGLDPRPADRNAVAGAVYDERRAFWAAVDTVIIWRPGELASPAGGPSPDVQAVPVTGRASRRGPGGRSRWGSGRP